jgi:ribosomal protein S27E
MKKKNQEKTSKEVLFIVEQIDENQLTNTCNYHYFHNNISHRHSNKEVLFKSDFHLIETKELAKLEMNFNKFKLIITESKDILNQLAKLYEIQECSETAYNKDKYICYKDFNNCKIIVQVNNFNHLAKEDINEFVGDIILLSSRYILEKETGYFDEDGIFGSKELIFYQWTCAKCNQFNLKIIHKSEPKQVSCKDCNESILNSNGKLKSEMLIKENGTLRTTIDKL